MSIAVTKGNSFSGQYAQAIIATATDWTGSVSVYQTFPGTVIFSVPLVRSLDGTKLLFTLSVEQIQNLNAGLYSLVGNIKSVALNVDTYRMDYMTVIDAIVSSQPMTTLTMTIAKIDGTPTGVATTSLTNTATGTQLITGWKGVKVTAVQTTAYNIGTEIIGNETITTETNAAGYAQFSVITGSIVTVSCPSFGKSVTIDTTGLTTIDLSTYF